MCYGMDCPYEHPYTGECHFTKYYPEDAACMRSYLDESEEQEEQESEDEDIEEPSNKN